MPPIPQHEATWTHHEAIINGLRLHYVEAGATAGNTEPRPLVILLHGFPEFWYSWRHQITALAGAGFHVIAPDMRGYNTSEKPSGVHNYRIEILTDDIAALIRHAGAKRATVVGHDWGGVIAWYMPMRYPSLVEKLIVLNAPHPLAMVRQLRKASQRLRSSYALFFQLPLLPEMTLRSRNYAMLRNVLRADPVRPHTFTKHDIRRYVEANAQPGALTATLNYYRAAFRFTLPRVLRQTRRIKTPTLLIWGEEDHYLEIGMTENLEQWVPNLR